MESTNLEDYLDPEELPNISKSQSAIGGALQGATFNLADEIAGAARAGMDPALAKRIGLLKAYQKYRDESRSKFKQEQEANPASYFGGEVGGSLATLPLTGAASTLPKAMAIGGAYGFGGAEGEPLEQAGQAIGGAALGGLAHKGLEKLDLPGVGSAIKDFAEERAYKATGPMKKDVRGAYNTNQLGKIGRDLLDEGVVTPFANQESMTNKALQVKDKYAPQISQSLGAMDKLTQSLSKNPYGKELQNYKIDSNQVVSDLYDKFLYPLRQNEVLRDTLAPKVERIIENISNDYSGGKINLLDAENIKRRFQALSNYDTTVSKPEQKIFKDIANYFKNLVEGSLERQSNAASKIAESRYPKIAEDISSLKGIFTTAKSKTGSMTDALDNLKEREVKELANRFVSPSDYGIGASSGIAAALGSGDAALAGAVGVGGALANKFLRTYGNQLTAVSADKIGKILSNEPEKLGKFGALLTNALQKGGPKLMQITSATLAKKSPEYAQKLYSAISGKQEAQEAQDESLNLEDYIE